MTVNYYQNKRNKFDLIYDINDSFTPHHFGLSEIRYQLQL